MSLTAGTPGYPHLTRTWHDNMPEHAQQ